MRAKSMNKVMLSVTIGGGRQIVWIRHGREAELRDHHGKLLFAGTLAEVKEFAAKNSENALRKIA